MRIRTHVVAAVATAVVVATGVPAHATTRWHGYRLPRGTHADSGWIGGWKAAQTPVYRFEPRKSAAPTSYTPARKVTDLGGTAHGPSRRATQLAGYVLATYGARPDNIQAAATDAVTYHYLAGGKWRLGKTRASQRIARSGTWRRYIRSYAATMMSEASKYAGPYTQTMTATDTTVGSATLIRLKVTSAAGYGLRNAPVVVNFPGADPQTVYTSTDGVAQAYFTATAPGPHQATARVTAVPAWWLEVRNPTRKRASAVAVAGRRTTLSAATTVNVAGAQGITITNAASVSTTGNLLAGSWTVTGGSGARPATVGLYGPFGSSGAAACTGTPAFQTTTSIDADGTHPLPDRAAATSGYYRWSVAVAANPFTAAASACGDLIRVQAPGRVSQYRPDSATVTVPRGEPFKVGARVAGFDRTEAHTLTARLYGPFAVRDNAACVASKLRPRLNQTRTVATNGDYPMGSVTLSRSADAGWYVWQTTLTNGSMITGATSTCGVAYQVK